MEVKERKTPQETCRLKKMENGVREEVVIEVAETWALRAPWRVDPLRMHLASSGAPTKKSTAWDIAFHH
jgi:hypothetical protein